MIHINVASRARLVGKENGRRRLFLIDIENVVGGAKNVTAEGACWARSILERELAMRSEEHAVIAVTAAHALFPSSGAFPGKSLHVRFGASGADFALIDAIDEGHVATRYDEVVVVSGDGVFSDLAARVAGHGARVVAVGHPAGMSSALRLAVHETIYLSTTYEQSWRVA